MASKRSAAYSLSVFFLILITYVVSASPCSYKAYIKPGSRFRIVNRGFPDFYEAGESCTWYAVTHPDAILHLRCPVVNLAQGDYLFVTTGSLREGMDFDQSFEVQGKSVLIELVSNSWAGGLFQCEIWADEPDTGDEDCDCGWSYSTRIVGGVEAGVHEFPSMAALVNRYGLYCGAVIIAKRVAITTAHSVLGRDPNDYRLLVGEHDISTGKDTNATKLLAISKFIPHEDYLNGHNDIAVIITKENIVFSARVGPACLPFSVGNLERKYVQAVGWGMTEFGGTMSDYLQKTFLQVVQPYHCQNAYNERFSDAQHICTYFDSQDACQGDSGGPIYYRDNNRMYLVGVISNGIDCGGKYPAINSRVSYFLNWITSVVPNSGFCVK
ncbi:venom serine protease-like isoform X1 [Cimex lectularius]|uniref:Peptidase S1 domain-containing protein n=1 Tax=Cimex lectularius TaxID=79782 RepID=A0A8I6SB13_CIMLE|nr:venom serine protease-like isoform X1 [Cimex lectularius]XP_014260447.1 venom serine protease-like isoform X1 [Cimex lectularius]XP_014260448.1 venom serine protease-like isoform X1 [Cimex lectularius]